MDAISATAAKIYRRIAPLKRSVPMSPTAVKRLAARAYAVMMDARRKPQCAPAARNFLSLVARHARRRGEGWLAAEAKRFERAILGN